MSVRSEPSRALGLGISALSVVGVVALWAYVTRAGGPVLPLFLAPPQAVLEGFLAMLSTPFFGHTLQEHAASSLRIVLGGWLVGGLVGVPLGIAMAWRNSVQWIVNPIFQILRPIPPLAWIPLALIWLGIDDASRIFVVFLSAVVPWVLNSVAAVQSVDSILIRAARTLGAPSRIILVRVVIKSALPTILAGARIAMGNAWTTLIAAELLGASIGLGFVALNAARALNTAALLVAMFAIGIIGAAFSLLLRSAARLAGPWAEEVQAR